MKKDEITPAPKYSIDSPHFCAYECPEISAYGSG